MEVDNCAGENWSGKRDSNPRPSAWKAYALATELFPPRFVTWGDRTHPRGRPALTSMPKEWWGKDSNLRRLSRQIYSLLPLTAREPHRDDVTWSWRRDSNPQPPHYK